MSSPSRSTSPAREAPGTSSCIRLRIRRKVDLPHPDGPTSAVTSPARISRSTSASTWWSPNHACTPRATRSPGRACPTAGRTVVSVRVIGSPSQGGGEEVREALEHVPEQGEEDGCCPDPDGAGRVAETDPRRDVHDEEEELAPEQQRDGRPERV